MESMIQEVLLNEEQIKTRIKELAEVLNREYADKDPIVVGVLKGVVVFYADMVREFKFPCLEDRKVSVREVNHSTPISTCS